MTRDTSVSEVIAEILLISVIVVALSVTGVYLSQNVVPTKIPVINFEACIKEGTVWLYHTGGDSLNPRENSADFYLNLLDANDGLIKTVRMMPWSDKFWSPGTVLTIPTTLHPTLDPTIKKIQVIVKPSGGGEYLIDYVQPGSCSLTSGYIPGPGPGCLGHAHANFAVSVPDVTQPLHIQFTDTSLTDDPAYPVTGWEWDFGDGSAPEYGKDPDHIYLSPGSYTVRHRAHNACGSDELSLPVLVGGTCISSVTAKMKTDPNPPVSLNGTLLTVTFTDDDSYSTGSTIAGYDWDFGDGTAGTGPGPHSRTYTRGIYFIRLIVTDRCGNWAIATKQVSVATESDCFVTPRIIAQPSSGKTPLHVTLTDGSTTSRGWLTSWNWTLDDGTTATGPGPISRVYENPGPGPRSFPVSLTVGNSCGAYGTTNATIIVSPPGYMIQATADPGGTISPAGTVYVDEGKDQAFTITTQDCYENTDVLVDNSSIGPRQEYTFMKVDRDHTIHAVFSRLSFTITPGSTTGGTVFPSSPVIVPCGGNQTFISTADPCFVISYMNINGVQMGPQDSPNTTVFSNVHQNSTIFVTFNQISPVITASAGTGGTISPSGNVQVSCGGNQSFLITANPCNAITNITIDGIPSGPENSPNTTVFTNVTANHTIQALFQFQSYPISATAGVGGTISPAGITNVPCANDQRYVITADSCYRISNVIVDGVPLGGQPSPYTYTFTSVLGAHSISATFEHLGLFTITSSAYYMSAGSYSPIPVTGKIAPEGMTTVACSGSVSYSIVSSFDLGKVTYILADVIIDGEHVGPINPYTFNNVLQDHTIVAVYAPKCYFITGKITSSVTRSPFGGVRVELYRNASPDVLLWYTYTLSDGSYKAPNVVANAGDRYDVYVGNTTPGWRTISSYLYDDPKPEETGPWRYKILMNPGSKCDRYLDWSGST